mmetsp:Transcript_13058/g.33201  ORF Transcript_13058/g.33201 Transcript_13058/m.33201 type:complete len:230 (-) Transcript_13058:1121-1810(-)
MLAVHNFDAETIARPVLLADNVTLLTRPGVALRLAKWTPRSFVLNIPGDSRFHTHEDKFTFARTVTVSRVQAVRDALQWSQQVWVACSSSKHDWPANLCLPIGTNQLQALRNHDRTAVGGEHRAAIGDELQLAQCRDRILLAGLQKMAEALYNVRNRVQHRRLKLGACLHHQRSSQQRGVRRQNERSHAGVHVKDEVRAEAHHVKKGREAQRAGVMSVGDLRLQLMRQP